MELREEVLELAKSLKNGLITIEGNTIIIKSIDEIVEKIKEFEVEKGELTNEEIENIFKYISFGKEYNFEQEIFISCEGDNKSFLELVKSMEEKLKKAKEKIKSGK